MILLCQLKNCPLRHFIRNGSKSSVKVYHIQTFGQYVHDIPVYRQIFIYIENWTGLQTQRVGTRKYYPQTQDKLDCDSILSEHRPSLRLCEYDPTRGGTGAKRKLNPCFLYYMVIRIPCARMNARTPFLRFLELLLM